MSSRLGSSLQFLLQKSSLPRSWPVKHSVGNFFDDYIFYITISTLYSACPSVESVCYVGHTLAFHLYISSRCDIRLILRKEKVSFV